MARCRLLHDWGQWRFIHVTRYFTSGRTVDTDGQERICQRCGKIQRSYFL